MGEHLRTMDSSRKNNFFTTFWIPEGRVLQGNDLGYKEGKQNHDLEEQLRQRDVGHNVQEENQNQGDSSERRGPERPKGSNEPSRPERRNLSMPSFMDTAPPPILAEMQAMKEQMEVMMNALKGRVSSGLNDLVNKTDSPFTIPVNSCPLP